MKTYVAILLLCSFAWCADAALAEPKPVKVFILAGQSNMEGQAVADLAGKDYNEGKGTLIRLMRDSAIAGRFAHLRTDDGKWAVNENVWVSYQRENQPLLYGPLTVGFSVYGDSHHFGPELQFGFAMSSSMDGPMLLIKTAWGGKDLYRDFRPPSSGGVTGKYYQLMIQQVREALARNAKKDSAAGNGHGYELAGLVWYQGWNDGCQPATAVPEYERNLVNLINDVRAEFKSPALPVVVGELTGPWVKAEGAWEKLRRAQEAATHHREFSGNVLFVPTHDFVRPANESPNPGHGHHEFGNAETYFLVGDALAKGMLQLLEKPVDPKAVIKPISEKPIDAKP